MDLIMELHKAFDVTAVTFGVLYANKLRHAEIDEQTDVTETFGT